MEQNDIKSVALIPDRLALYRYAIFKRLSDYRSREFELTIYADIEEDIPGLKLVDSKYCDRKYSNGGISWIRIKNIAIRNICFWQTGLLRLAWLGKHNVHVYWGEAHRLSTWASAIFSRIRGKRVVYWGHGLYGNEGPFKCWIRCIFYRIANEHLVYSDYGKNLLLDRRFEANRIHVIKNSLDFKKQNEYFLNKSLRADFSKSELFSESDRVLLFIGRLEPQKHLHQLIEALVILNRKFQECYKLLIIGEGSQHDTLVKLANEMNTSEHVLFYGECYDEKILAPMIMMADICLSPGEVGLTALHSLIYGTPVITHDNFSRQMPEFEAIYPGVSGEFYQYGNLDDLCSKIKVIIELVDAGVINPATCREAILKYYNTEYQAGVFVQMLNSLK